MGEDYYWTEANDHGCKQDDFDRWKQEDWRFPDDGWRRSVLDALSGYFSVVFRKKLKAPGGSPKLSLH